MLLSGISETAAVLFRVTKTKRSINMGLRVTSLIDPTDGQSGLFHKDFMAQIFNHKDAV